MCSTLVVQMKGKSTVISLKMESFRIGGGINISKINYQNKGRKNVLDVRKIYVTGTWVAQ